MLQRAAQEERDEAQEQRAAQAQEQAQEPPAQEEREGCAAAARMGVDMDDLHYQPGKIAE